MREVNAVLESLQKDPLTMDSNRLAADLGNSVSTAEKDGESVGRFPSVRHEYLLGLIGRPHFPAQAQVEEREDRRRFDWDRWSTILMAFAKRRAESPSAAGRSVIYNRKSNWPKTEPWGCH